ncbi:MAG: glycosyltransferase family 4 protein [Ignavibacteriales bacterium]|nr:glycosyltransferase family 4 protein [Ignavibacteriales bacterium]
MKILYSCLSKSWGGMEMVTLTGIKQLLKHNIIVELLCANDSRLQLEANNLGIIIHSVNISKLPNPITILKTSTIIKSGCYDLIHSHASKDLWVIVPALKIIKNKTLLFFTKHIGSFILKKDYLHNKIYSRINVAIAISSVIKNNLIDTTSLPPHKIELIYNGVDAKKFNPTISNRDRVRKEFSYSDNDIVIGMIARFSPGKGHRRILRSAKILSTKFINLKFMIVGEASRGEDDYANRIKSLSQNLKIENLILTGFRSDIPDVISAFDIFIFPSHAEAFGIALIEAMAMEKPSVCANSDGVLDIAVDGKTNILFQNKNAEDLAKKTEKLILDENLRLSIGKAARERVLKMFDIEIVTDKIIESYNNYLNRN